MLFRSILDHHIIDTTSLIYLKLHQGYLYNKVVTHTFDLTRRNMSQTDRELIELATETIDTPSTNNRYCSECMVKHVGTFMIDQCEQRRNFGPSLEIDLLFSREITTHQHVYCIGVKILKYLPVILREQGWINAGVPSLGSYKVGLEINITLDRSQGSLAKQLQSKL